MSRFKRLLSRWTRVEEPPAPGFIRIEEKIERRGLFGKAYGVDLLIQAADLKDLDLRIADAKAALLTWKRTRGAKCKDLKLALAAEPAHQVEAAEKLQTLYREDPEISSFLQKLDARVALADREGRLVYEYDWAEAEAPPKRKRGPGKARPWGWWGEEKGNEGMRE